MRSGRTRWSLRRRTSVMNRADADAPEGTAADRSAGVVRGETVAGITKQSENNRIPENKLPGRMALLALSTELKAKGREYATGAYWANHPLWSGNQRRTKGCKSVKRNLPLICRITNGIHFQRQVRGHSDEKTGGICLGRGWHFLRGAFTTESRSPLRWCGRCRRWANCWLQHLRRERCLLRAARSGAA